MRPRTRIAALLAVALGCLILLAGEQPASAAVLYRTFSNGALTVHYRVVLPEPFDPAKPYPAVLAFGGGPQSMETVDSVIERNFRAQAERRGYLVVVPAAPNGQLFFEGGERVIAAFLQHLLTEYHVLDGKFHIAGPSNGGISAFHIAALYPSYFWSITAFPGYLPEDTPAHLQALAGMCIYMFVGELDPLGWQVLMQSQAREFRDHGLAVRLTIEPGQPHRIETLAGPNAARLFDLFQQAQHGCAAQARRSER